MMIGESSPESVSEAPNRPLRSLRTELACRELVLRAAACTDAGDARGLALLFSADAELVRPGGEAISGREAIERVYRERPSGRITAHLICGTLFDDIGPKVAQASSRVLLWTADAHSDAGLHGRLAAPRQMVGTFLDTFVRTAEGWRIARRLARFDLFRE